MNPARRVPVAVVGAGRFGRHHCRIVHQSLRADLVAVVDVEPSRAAEVAALYGSQAMADYRELPGKVEAAIVAAPTSAHAGVGCALLESGIHVLVEKPIAADLSSADRLLDAAKRSGSILQVGHLERFNPAVCALETRTRLPLFFEIHRLSIFDQRSLDIDVVLDLMIHDIDIVLNLVERDLQEVRAAGISILSGKVDIANVRLQFEGGCVANLTASRVSTDRVRKLRLFQPQQYVSLDYGRQDAVIFTVNRDRKLSFEQLPITKAEPLALQFDAFLDSIETRKAPKTSGPAARRTLEVALLILDKIKEHAEVVEQSLLTGWNL